MDLGDAVQVTPKTLNILEGSYSTHPELIGRYDLKIFSQDLAGDTERTHFKTQRPRAAQDVRGKMDPAREPLLHFLSR